VFLEEQAMMTCKTFPIVNPEILPPTGPVPVVNIGK